MNIQKVMHKTLKWIQHRGNKGFQKPTLKQQLDFMYSLPEPENDIDRAYYQYLCQKRNEPKWKNYFFNITSFFLILFYQEIMLKRGRMQSFKNKADGVYISDGISDDIVPDSLKNEFPVLVKTNFEDDLGLVKDDIIFFNQIQKRYKSPYFLLKVLVKLAIYSSVIRLYQPLAIISYTEGSFTCALMTKYCESLGVEHINVQHGEYSRNTDCCGMRFHRMYIWDRFFYDSLCTLGDFKISYVIELPNSILKACEKNDGPFDYDITYYLQNHSREELVKIREMLEILKQKGYRCKVRPHPRESELEILQQCLSDIEIENLNSQSLSDSLNTTKYVVSFRSTVLLQAWFNEKKVIIDDYSSRKNAAELEDGDFFLMHKGVMKMTEFMKCCMKNIDM